MTDGPAEPRIEERRPPLWERVSIVWLVPVFAVLVALYVAWQTWSDRGPVIFVSFENAAGLVAGQTPVRYRDVRVGTVEGIAFSSDLSEVLVEVRVSPDLASYFTKEAEFWIVRPEISAQGISGLNTVLSGTYIGAELPSTPGPVERQFEGLERAPLTPIDQPGLRITLRSYGTASLGVGAPILYRGVEVGQIEDLTLSDDGQSVIYTAFINAPYNEFVTEGSRFWNASGFSFELGLSGAQLNVGSLVSLLRGGVTFETVFDGGGPASSGRGFRLYESASAAQSSLFDTATKTPVTIGTVFEGSIGGLTVGSTVSYRGVPVGRVSSVSTRLTSRDGASRVELLAGFEVEPGRLGLPPDAQPGDTLELLANLVESNALRARLSSSTILSGSRQIDLVEMPDAPADILRLDAEPFPMMPAAFSEADSMAQTASEVLNRVDQLPLAEVLASATQAMDSVTLLLRDPSTRSLPAGLNGMLGDIRGLLQSEGVQRAPEEVLASLQSVRALLQQAEEAALVDALTQALQDASAAAQTLTDATDTLTPELGTAVSYAQTTLRAASDLIANPATQRLPGTTANVLAGLRDLVNNPEFQNAPNQLGDALARVNTILTQLENAAIADRLASSLDSAEVAADRIGALVLNAETLPEDVAELLARGSSTLESVSTLLDDPATRALPGTAQGALSDLRTILGDPATTALPGEARDMLRVARRFFEDVEAAALPERLATALDGATTAADELAALASASADIPGNVNELVLRGGEVVDAAGRLVADPALSALPREATSALEDLRALLNDPATRALPATLNASIGAAETLLDQMLEGQLAQTLTTTLQDASRAAASIADASDGVPGLIDELNLLAVRANEVPLDQLARDVQNLVRSADNVLSAPGAEELPAALTESLRELRLTLQELRGAGIGDGLSGALTSATEAADAIAIAARGVPALLTRLDRIANTADATLLSYGEGSEVNEAALRALAEIRDAARDIGALVRTIERNPNSVLFGR
ncbi:MlaD family protein [Pontivivens insulae]|uniref:Paraquat-inducible protein B n=1 Tax=Pontivivens insulae TaxID=1639689 RepID=A0A2R8A874_9RHOB|nr:MlaD family protein [Pontivivens insulae]RED18539.1 paraquat-inducible protein B [Pontivivens insulae]SPF28437.1 Paraquat-inducible protein B [Pontivivens insulae]